VLSRIWDSRETSARRAQHAAFNMLEALGDEKQNFYERGDSIIHQHVSTSLQDVHH
jgi:hypothetical protein